MQCALEGQTFKTRVIKNSFLPVWDETVTVQVSKVAEAGELELSLIDWNATQSHELVGGVTIPKDQMLALLRGKSGKTVDRTLPLTLEGAPVVGHDGQNAQIVVRLRPFVRCSHKFINEQTMVDNKDLVGSDKHNSNERTPRRKIAPTLTPQCASIMEDVCRHSRFVHAQLWRPSPHEKTLELRGEHFTTSCFAEYAAAAGITGAQEKIQDMLTLCVASRVDVGNPYPYLTLPYLTLPLPLP